MQQQEQHVPTLDELEQALMQVTVQRAALKDQLETLDRQAGQIGAVVQHMRAFRAKAIREKEEAAKAAEAEVTLD